MIGQMTPMAPPEDPNLAARMLVSLIECIADPVSSKKRIEDYIAAHKTATDQIARAQKETAVLEKLRAKTLAELDEARRKHDAQLATEREAHLQSCRRRTEELDARERETARLNTQAQADATEAARIRPTCSGAFESYLAKRREAVVGMNNALQSFLAEIKARPKMRAAIASGATLNGQPVSELFGWWEALFDRLETWSDPLAVKLHDDAVCIVSRKSVSVKDRVLALVELLEPYSPERHQQ